MHDVGDIVRYGGLLPKTDDQERFHVGGLSSNVYRYFFSCFFLNEKIHCYLYYDIGPFSDGSGSTLNKSE